MCVSIFDLFLDSYKLPLIDLKSDNILLAVESQSIFVDMVNAEAQEPTPYKLDGGTAIYYSRNFGVFKNPPGRPRIADFGLAVRGDVPQPHNHDIQANLLQAPEVILRAGWSYSADIWNLGVLVRIVASEIHEPCIDCDDATALGFP